MTTPDISKYLIRYMDWLKMRSFSSVNWTYIWSTALYVAATRKLRKVDQQYLEVLELWPWRRMEKISWTDRVKNEEVLQMVRRRSMAYIPYIAGRLIPLVTF